MSLIREVEIAGKKIKFEFNKFAKQANGSVMVSCGDTQVLVTVCSSEEAKEGQDFFPLTVDYFERFYAAGRIPGGFFKRESRPTEREVLTARTIDRPLRPCFPEAFLNLRRNVEKTPAGRHIEPQFFSMTFHLPSPPNSGLLASTSFRGHPMLPHDHDSTDAVDYTHPEPCGYLWNRARLAFPI